MRMYTYLRENVKLLIMLLMKREIDVECYLKFFGFYFHKNDGKFVKFYYIINLTLLILCFSQVLYLTFNNQTDKSTFISDPIWLFGEDKQYIYISGLAWISCSIFSRIVFQLNRNYYFLQWLSEIKFSPNDVNFIYNLPVRICLFLEFVIIICFIGIFWNPHCSWKVDLFWYIVDTTASLGIVSGIVIPCQLFYFVAIYVNKRFKTVVQLQSEFNLVKVYLNKLNNEIDFLFKVNKFWRNIIGFIYIAFAGQFCFVMYLIIYCNLKLTGIIFTYITGIVSFVFSIILPSFFASIVLKNVSKK